VTTLEINNVGPIRRADVRFGDLTVLVGPQASGKSIFLQFFKLVMDAGAILAELRQYGLDWSRDVARFLDVYLGEGMHGVWQPGRSKLSFNGESVDLAKLVGRQKRLKRLTTFYIPAQRVLTLGEGWPRPFTDYRPGDPFCVRDFSEKVRVLMETGLGQDKSLFPQPRRLQAEFRDLIASSIFSRFVLGIDKDRHGSQKRLILNVADGADPLPFMVWSAGQREFVPLLLGLYWLLPPTKTPRRGDVEWVVIEEPEMGLHPKAIAVVLLLVMALLARGYRVCISTHSPHVLDLVWALRIFQDKNAAPARLLELFDAEPTQAMRQIAEKVLQKRARVYYFDGTSHIVTDISNLDPASDNAAEAGWGGLSDFSGRVADVVADVVSGAEE
jgi:AAA domain, putative AbiEii toxin, Type IV TA system